MGRAQRQQGKKTNEGEGMKERKPTCRVTVEFLEEDGRVYQSHVVEGANGEYWQDDFGNAMAHALIAGSSIDCEMTVVVWEMLRQLRLMRQTATVGLGVLADAEKLHSGVHDFWDCVKIEVDGKKLRAEE
jgi:hypothetical protein